QIVLEGGQGKDQTEPDHGRKKRIFDRRGAAPVIHEITKNADTGPQPDHRLVLASIKDRSASGSEARRRAASDRTACVSGRPRRVPAPPSRAPFPPSAGRYRAASEGGGARSRSSRTTKARGNRP